MVFINRRVLVSIFSEIIENIKKKEAIASADVSQAMPGYQTRLGQIRRAKTDIEELQRQYQENIKELAVFILATGSQANSFASIAEDEYGCFSIAVDEFYSDLVKDVSPALFKGVSANSQLFDIVNDIFTEQALQLGIVSYPQMIFKTEYKKILNNRKDLVDLIKRAFTDSVGGEVVGLYAIKVAAKKGLDIEFTGKVAPIVLFSKDQSIIKQLSKDLRYISNNVHIVATGSVNKDIQDNAIDSIIKPGKKSVEKTLLSIRENIN